MSHHHDHDHTTDATHGGLPEMLDLDAQVLAAPLEEARAEIARLADGPIGDVLDLGAGTGSGTFGLLEHFPDAHVTAIDGSEDMVQRLQRRSEQLGLGHRLTLLCADLDEGVPSRRPADLVWASASLHHLADPDRTLRQVSAAIRPGGLLAVIELTGLPRFLADGTSDGTTEARAHTVLAGDRAVDMPAMGGDWASRLAGAGLVVELDRPIVVDLPPPSTPATSEYAFATLSRIRGAVAGRLDTADAERLGQLLDGGTQDVRGRRDLLVRTERQLLIGRRPW